MRAPWTLTVGLLVCAACAGPQRRPRGDGPMLQALLLNGGGSPRTNYYSHLLHLGAMHDVLRVHGVAPAQIDVLSADGEATAPDLSVARTAEGTDAWLLDGTTLERPLGHPVRLVSAHSKATTFSPATRAELGDWFRGAAGVLRAGDTLLLFVTDHGERGKTPLNTRITLWDRQSITVTELGELTASLPAGVRVVTVMSQCYSGGFAELALRPRAGASGLGDSCGYFSTTADRMASGCYPEMVGEHDGYAWRFIRGLGRTASLPAAHAEAMVTDRTPDVPLRSSDLFLGRLVERAAVRRQTTPDQLVSELAAAALDADRQVDEARLIAEVARSFAIPVPREPGALAQLTRRLDELKSRLDQSVDTWESAVGELAQANLEDFLRQQPAWPEMLTPSALERLTFTRLEPVQRRLVTELGTFTRARPARFGQLGQGHNRHTAARASRTRSDVRVAALLRLRTLLTSLVGQQLLASEGTAAERADFAALRRCESLALPRPDLAAAPAMPQPRPFPSIDNDEKVAVAVAPAVLGVALADLPAAARTRPPLFPMPEGAMTVVSVDRGSPAAAAGLAPGDILLGETGDWVAERGAMKLRLAMAQPREHQLDVRRAGRTLQLQARLAARGRDEARPRDKDLPASGRAALRELTAMRGGLAPALRPGRPYLLFFWATWCTFCKLALPELQALERQRGVTVVSISDERELIISDFLKSWRGPFPDLVARDPERLANEAFAVEGYPTFVLVDEAGRVNMRTVGYRPDNGLPIPGWSFRPNKEKR